MQHLSRDLNRALDRRLSRTGTLPRAGHHSPAEWATKAVRLGLHPLHAVQVLTRGGLPLGIRGSRPTSAAVEGPAAWGPGRRQASWALLRRRHGGRARRAAGRLLPWQDSVVKELRATSTERGGTIWTLSRVLAKPGGSLADRHGPLTTVPRTLRRLRGVRSAASEALCWRPGGRCQLRGVLRARPDAFRRTAEALRASRKALRDRSRSLRNGHRGVRRASKTLLRGPEALQGPDEALRESLRALRDDGGALQEPPGPVRGGSGMSLPTLLLLHQSRFADPCREGLTSRPAFSTIPAVRSLL